MGKKGLLAFIRVCLEADSKVKHEMSKSFEQDTWNTRDMQCSQPARSTRVQSEAGARGVPGRAMPGPEGIEPAAKPSSSDRRDVEKKGETRQGGRVLGNGAPTHRGQAAPASFEVGVGRHPS
jgi:hypothetical protein